MHSWDSVPDGEDGSCITIHHDGDPRGSILRVVLPCSMTAQDLEDRYLKPEAPSLQRTGDDQWWLIELPYDVLQSFVLDMIRDRSIVRVEDATDKELIQLIVGTSILGEVFKRHLEDHPVEPHVHPHSHLPREK